jgi:DNA-binding MarR family transcriptional regulator
MAEAFILESFLPFRLNRLAAEVSERLASIYGERFGIDVPQWRVIATLSTNGGCTAQEIVDSTRTHKSTVSRAVKELEANGLIERIVSDADGRAYSLSLSNEGRRLFQKLQPLVLDFERALLEMLASGDAKALVRGISALEAALDLGDSDT